MKRNVWALVLAMGIIVLLQSTTVARAETPYDSMMMAIQEWYKSNPKPTFKSPESKQVFEWRVQLETFNYETAVERFLFYQSLLQEIGDGQFTHDNWHFNSKSIRAKMLEDYPFWDYSDEVIDPISLFATTYEWFKSGITEDKEHIYWLRRLLFFASDIRDADRPRLTEHYSKELNDICRQYIAIAGQYKSKSSIMNIDYLYSDLTIFASTVDPIDHLLTPLSYFVRKFATSLNQDTQDAIIGFILPDYVENDLAIKIYAALMKRNQ